MSTDDEVRDAWRRIEAWLAAHVPPLAKALRPPAPPEEVARVEEALDVTLPSEMRASLAIHDGQRKRAFEVFSTWGLLALTDIERVWQILRDVAAKGLLSETDDPENVFIEGP